MNCFEIIILAFALSIDACVVSFSYGLCTEEQHRHNALALATTTGFFQGFMPVLGFLFTDLIRTFIEPYSKWIVFLIFMYLGITFIKEFFQQDRPQKICINPQTLFMIGIATSIDAFSAGFSLSLTSSPMKFSVISIGIVTFINSLIGYYTGNKLKIFKPYILEIIGGVILIILALRAIL